MEQQGGARALAWLNRLNVFSVKACFIFFPAHTHMQVKGMCLNTETKALLKSFINLQGSMFLPFFFSCLTPANGLLIKAQYGHSGEP